MMSRRTHQAECRINLARKDRVDAAEYSAGRSQRRFPRPRNDVCIDVQPPFPAARRFPDTVNESRGVYKAQLFLGSISGQNALQLLQNPGALKVTDDRPQACCGLWMTQHIVLQI
jgi:hypothetical protein